MNEPPNESAAENCRPALNARPHQRVMKKRPFYLASAFFGVIAFILNSVGHDHLAQSSSRKAHELEAYAVQRDASGLQHVPFVPSAETIRLQNAGKVFTVVGLVFTFVGVVFLVIAGIRHERGWYWILTGLFVLDILVVMLL